MFRIILRSLHRQTTSDRYFPKLPENAKSAYLLGLKRAVCIMWC
ncbi:MAG TPA: hypothetical protein VK203_18495 [Nostocaceae cyanobacterium]|nr:hypothetical protein [Nostocaceae cyanobacterium]